MEQRHGLQGVQFKTATLLLLHTPCVSEPLERCGWVCVIVVLPLYCFHGNLVGQQDGRSDLSHPVHSDNCILDDYGECHKVPPAYTWRDYRYMSYRCTKGGWSRVKGHSVVPCSALLYLNGDFEGGEFFYAHSSKDLSPDVSGVCVCSNQRGQNFCHAVLELYTTCLTMYFQFLTTHKCLPRTTSSEDSSRRR